MKIIYEDKDLLVIDKPPGVIADEALAQKLRGFLAHRLDKDTSGLLLVAKNQKTLENLQTQFKQRQVKKEYLVLVHGEILEKGVVEGAIGRNPKNHQKFMATLEGGREAKTEYEPLERLQVTGDRLQEIFHDFNKMQFSKLFTVHYNLFTFLAVRPKTGRTHQIRVHLKYIGHPIVGDKKYVGRKIYRLDARWAHRQFLHAAKIGFRHPVSGQWMELESPLPDDLKKVLDSLRSLEQ